MAYIASSSFPLLLLLLLVLLVIAGILSSSAAVSPAVSAHIHSALRPISPNSRVGDILGALEALDDNSRWAEALAVAYLSASCTNATIFVPTNVALADAMTQPIPSSDLVHYHISPETLPLSRLLQLRTGDRIPTLLAGASIPVTGNLSLAGAAVTHPDIFYDGSLAVHGVGGVLAHTTSNSHSPAAAETSQAIPNVAQQYRYHFYYRLLLMIIANVAADVVLHHWFRWSNSKTK